jgi:hypothetical protein
MNDYIKKLETQNDELLGRLPLLEAAYDAYRKAYKPVFRIYTHKDNIKKIDVSICLRGLTRDIDLEDEYPLYKLLKGGNNWVMHSTNTITKTDSNKYATTVEINPGNIDESIHIVGKLCNFKDMEATIYVRKIDVDNNETQYTMVI